MITFDIKAFRIGNVFVEIWRGEGGGRGMEIVREKSGRFFMTSDHSDLVFQLEEHT